MRPSPLPHSGPALAEGRTAGFSIVELVIAVIILAVGVLGLAGTTALVVRQVTLADVNTERSAALQTVIERIRATNTNTITPGSQTIGSYAVSWTITDSTNLSRTVRVITTGPGLRKDSAAVVPMLGASVADTFTLVMLRP
jgi:Tfp pilus assembly protein PilV